MVDRFLGRAVEAVGRLWQNFWQAWLFLLSAIPAAVVGFSRGFPIGLDLALKLATKIKDQAGGEGRMASTIRWPSTTAGGYRGGVWTGWLKVVEGWLKVG